MAKKRLTQLDQEQWVALGRKAKTARDSLCEVAETVNRSFPKSKSYCRKLSQAVRLVDHVRSQLDVIVDSVYPDWQEASQVFYGEVEPVRSLTMNTQPNDQVAQLNPVTREDQNMQSSQIDTVKATAQKENERQPVANIYESDIFAPVVQIWRLEGFELSCGGGNGGPFVVHVLLPAASEVDDAIEAAKHILLSGRHELYQVDTVSRVGLLTWNELRVLVLKGLFGPSYNSWNNVGKDEDEHIQDLVQSERLHGPSW